MIYIILKYAKSHIYELHALLAGALAFLLMFPVKKPVKKWICRFTARRSETNKRWKKNRILYQKRLGLLLIALDFFLSGVIFLVLAWLSPLICFSVKTMWLSGILSLTLYGVYDQLFTKEKETLHE